MKDLAYIKNRFEEVYYTLEDTDIAELEKHDNGPLNNVIVNINKECFGVVAIIESADYTIDLFYVANKEILAGDLLRLKLSDPDYVQLLFYFCQFLVIKYNDLDTIGTFNCFQLKLRAFLEKEGFFTTTTLELKRFEGQDFTMMSNAPKGIKNLVLFDRVDYYRKYFNNNYSIRIDKIKNYTYLMLNDDTALIKIGQSNNPCYRERTLQSKEPKVHLIACWETPKTIEKDLHNMYKYKRIRGEWFRLNMTDLKKLAQFMIEYS